jgi:AcrR family transcriptional regulator
MFDEAFFKDRAMARNNDAAGKKIQILQALDQCLQEKPFDRTSIKDIARAAGVNHGLLHYYFKSKEDILINYIDYVMELYKSMLDDWLKENSTHHMDVKSRIEEFFKFMSERITLNNTLSAVFIEIWEIALYNLNVRTKLQRTYREWIGFLTTMLTPLAGDAAPARQIATASIAFLEGMALFSILLDTDTLDFHETLNGFQKKIIAMADEKHQN